MTELADRPLFVPLKGEFFDMFADGTKNTEYRLYGPRWNERTCRIGRAVVLSRGYGKQRRLRGTVTDFWKDRLPTSADFQKCYPGKREADIACIQIKVER